MLREEGREGEREREREKGVTEGIQKLGNFPINFA